MEIRATCTIFAPSKFLDEACANYRKKKMETALQGFYVNIPQADTAFFEELMKKMGWSCQTKESLLENYLKLRPADADLSEEEILEELSAVRYGEQ